MIKDSRKRLFEMMNIVAKMPIDVSCEYLPHDEEFTFLNEIDLKGDFSDVTHTCMKSDEMKDYLNSILANYSLPSHKRVKPDLIIHNKVIKKNDEGEIDVQAFIDDITAEPSNIMTTGNVKMIKSTTDDFYTVTIGLPAFKGIVYDKDGDIDKKFIVVLTCPGASKMCKEHCYARKGNYVRLPDVFLKQTRILNLLLNNPERFKEKLKEEIIKLGSKKGLKSKQMRFRWNDSGDFFTDKYFEIGREMMHELKAEGFDVMPYAHTKIAKVYNANRIPVDLSYFERPDAPDFMVSFSVDANKGELSKVDLTNAKTSEIVVKKHFDDLFQKSDGKHFDTDENDKLIFKDKNGMAELKRRISKEFGVENDWTLLSHNEMMNPEKAPHKNKPTYNVIVQSKGETDISTHRPDVMRTFFLIH